MPDKKIVPDFEIPIVELEEKILELKQKLSGNPSDKTGLENEINQLEQDCEKLKTDIYNSLNPYQKVMLARHPNRPYTLDYINLLFTDFVEIHGDRNFADDKSTICGIGTFEKEPIGIIGQQKGRNIEENIARNFGMMHPEGYRKALRFMYMCQKFMKPIIIFIDTPGAYPGIGAEERGQGEAIARNLREMSQLKIPIISIVIGEGSSGGALGIGVTDKILMLENSYYTVITPEGCSSILYKDASRAGDSAASLRITAGDLMEFKVADEIIKEPHGGAHRNPQQAADNIKASIKKNLAELKGIPANKLIDLRYKKYREIGSI